MEIKKLRDLFTMAASYARSAFMPEERMSTYWLKKKTSCGVRTSGTVIISRHIPYVQYTYAEARKLDDDKYTVHLVTKSRHNEPEVSGGNKTSETSLTSKKDGRSICTKAEALQILERQEHRLQMEGWRASIHQPMKWEHYSKLTQQSEDISMPKMPAHNPASI